MRPITETGTRNENTLLLAYLAVELLLLIVGEATYEMSNGMPCTIARYGAIFLNAVIAGIWFIRYGRSDRKDHSNLLAYGLFVTVIADFFLTWLGTEAYYIPGFIFFCIVEIIYAMYLKTTWRGYLLRFNIYIIALILLALSKQATVAYAIGLLNIVLVTTNAISAWTKHKQDVSLLFRIGIVLFFLCDISIVISGATEGTFSLVVSYLTWAFYAPSQVLITLSYVRSIRDS